ncbi:MAG: hypothetical protein M1824_002456 [Vezdaea acicularis]|nr:MAG: hypothetical protein M1824_002456 [Vezdaea acicularis]
MSSFSFLTSFSERVAHLEFSWSYSLYAIILSFSSFFLYNFGFFKSKHPFNIFQWISTRSAPFVPPHGRPPPQPLKGKPLQAFAPSALLAVRKAFKEDRLLALICDAIKERGDTYESRVFWFRTFTTIDPANVDAILNSQFEEFCLGHREAELGILLGPGIFTQDGTAWKHSRALLRPQFSRRRLENLAPIRLQAERLLRCIPNAEVVDLQPLFYNFTLDVTCTVLFGGDFNSLQGTDGAEKGFSEAFNNAQFYLHDGVLTRTIGALTGRGRLLRACRQVHEFVDIMVAKALAATPPESAAAEASKHDDDRDPTNLLADLIHDTRDPIALRSQLLHVLLAGRDTTACLLSWTFRALASHPPVFARLLSEVRSTLGTDPTLLTRDALTPKHLPYLHNVLKETMRLWPPVPANSRTAVIDTTLPRGGGDDGSAPMAVRRGEIVGYVPYAMHRRQDLFGPDADAFRPERWDALAGVPGLSKSYIPFNAGPRVCLGQELAVLEASYTLARLLMEFKSVKWPEGVQVPKVGEERQALALVMSAKDGCKVELERG